MEKKTKKKYPCQKSFAESYGKEVDWSHLKPVPFKICTKDNHTCEEKIELPPLPELLQEKMKLMLLGKPVPMKIDGVWKTVYIMEEDEDK